MRLLPSSPRAALAPVLALSVIAVLLLSGCGGGDDKLTIYSGRSETLVAPVIELFFEATGIEVEVKYGGTAALAATLLEEGDRTPADVYYAQDPGGLGAVEELLAPLPAETLARVADWARSPDALWVGVSGRARVLVYNPETLDASELPESIEALADSKWRGRLGWAPTNSSLLTMVTAMRELWGEERTLAWLEGIVGNEVKNYPKNTPQVTAVASGEIDIGLVNHYYLYRFIAEEGEDFPGRNYHQPVTGPGSLVMVSGVGVLERSDNKENAERFVEFLLSTVAQSYFAAETFEYPLIDGVAIHRLLTPIDQIDQPAVALADLADIDGTQDLMRRAGALP